MVHSVYCAFSFDTDAFFQSLLRCDDALQSLLAAGQLRRQLIATFAAPVTLVFIDGRQLDFLASQILFRSRCCRLPIAMSFRRPQLDHAIRAFSRLL